MKDGQVQKLSSTPAFWIVVPALAGLMVVMLIGLFVGTGTPKVNAVEPKRATVVVQYDEHSRSAHAIEYGASLAGIEALQLTGLDIVTRSTSFGDAVCRIGGVGCPADDCFCAAKYWSYWFWDGIAWQSYPVGADSSQISQTGWIEGWYWAEFGDVPAPVTNTLRALQATEWLAAHQKSSGDFGGVGSTAESLLAFGANGERIADPLLGAGEESGNLGAEGQLNQTAASIATNSAMSYLAVNGAAYSRVDPASAGKLAAATAAVDGCLPLGTVSPAAYFSPTLGTYSTQNGANAWAILGSAALGEPVPPAAIDHLVSTAQPTGGWEWAPGWGVDTNSTALAIQALRAVGEPISTTELVGALFYLESVQNGDGGFPYSGSPDTESDANSTAYVIQALLATGQDPTSPRWTVGGVNPYDYLATLQLGDGSFVWKAGSGASQLATQQAIPALLGDSLPVSVGAPATCPGTYLPLVVRE